MSLMLFFPLSELVKSAGAWQCCERKTRLTQSDKERLPDEAHALCCVSLRLTFLSHFHITSPRSPSVCLCVL